MLATDVDAEGLARAQGQDGWPQDAVVLYPLFVGVPAAWEAALARFGRIDAGPRSGAP